MNTLIELQIPIIFTKPSCDLWKAAGAYFDADGKKWLAPSAEVAAICDAERIASDERSRRGISRACAGGNDLSSR